MYSTSLLAFSLLTSVASASPYVGAPPSFLKRQLPIYKASVTSNENCGATVACGPGAAAVPGIGAAAISALAFENPNGAINGNGNTPLVNGAGAACGGCWHVTPQRSWFEATDNGLKLGKSVVVRINDRCADAGYCDQTAERPLNTGGYDADVHIDLCRATGAAQQFFGEVGSGIAITLAQYDPTCAGLDDGQLGGSLPPLVAL